MCTAIAGYRDPGSKTCAVAQGVGDHLRDRVHWASVLRALRRPAITELHDCVGHHRRAHVSRVHARHTRAVR